MALASLTRRHHQAIRTGVRIQLIVSGGTMDGRDFTLDQERVLVGRDPSAHVRFDADGDRKVSARHAELLLRDGVWLVRDLNSTNGTFRNGRRIADEEPLRDGDRLTLGTDGPSMLVRLASAHSFPSTPPTSGSGTAPGERPAAAPPRGGSRRWALLAAAALLLLVGAGLTASALIRGRGLPPGSTTISGGRRGVAGASGAASGSDGTETGADRPAAAAPQPIATAGEMDYAAVVAGNARAVALVAVEMPDGSASSGTAFAVGERLLVTNRHVVQVADGPRARRVLVKFSETDQWLPARVGRLDASADLATLVLDPPARAPQLVRGVAAPGTEPRVGDPVALIGFPLGTDTPMDGRGDDFIAAPSLFRGMVSKRVSDVLQIDAFAGHGSSGSPVLDRRGAVVGVVYGGPRDGGGRIVYAVSPQAVLGFLGDAEAQLVP